MDNYIYSLQIHYMEFEKFKVWSNNKMHNMYMYVLGVSNRIVHGRLWSIKGN